jgi:hypothetical protein
MASGGNPDAASMISGGELAYLTRVKIPKIVAGEW